MKEDVLSSCVMEGVPMLYWRGIGYHVIRFNYCLSLSRHRPQANIMNGLTSTALDLSAHIGSRS